MGRYAKMRLEDYRDRADKPFPQPQHPENPTATLTIYAQPLVDGGVININAKNLDHAVKQAYIIAKWYTVEAGCIVTKIKVAFDERGIAVAKPAKIVQMNARGYRILEATTPRNPKKSEDDY